MMKSTLLTALISFTLHASSGYACEVEHPESIILRSKTFEALLQKTERRLQADCTIYFDGSGSSMMKIHFTKFDKDRRKSGTVRRNFSGTVQCEKIGGGWIDPKLRGSADFKFLVIGPRRGERRTSCDEMRTIDPSRLKMSLSY